MQSWSCVYRGYNCRTGHGATGRAVRWHPHLTAVDRGGLAIVSRQNWYEDMYSHELLYQCSALWICKHWYIFSCGNVTDVLTRLSLLFYYFILYEKSLDFLRINLRIFDAMFSIIFEWCHVNISVFTIILNCSVDIIRFYCSTLNIYLFIFIKFAHMKSALLQVLINKVDIALFIFKCL